MKYLVLLLVLALAALIVIGKYTGSNACKGKGETVLQGAHGPICARVEVIRT